MRYIQTLDSTIVCVCLSFIIMNYVRKSHVIDFDLLRIAGCVCCPRQSTPHTVNGTMMKEDGEAVFHRVAAEHIVTEILEFSSSLGSFIVYYINFQYILQ